MQSERLLLACDRQLVSHQQHQQSNGQQDEDGEGVGDHDRRPLLGLIEFVLEGGMILKLAY